MEEFTEIPVIDISSLFGDNDTLKQKTAQEIHIACRDVGFFYIKGHNVSTQLQDDLFKYSQEFFNLPIEEKLKVSMDKGGKAWRGYFKVGDELTSGKPDIKEGLYLGEELGDDDERVQRGLPMHGRNLFPDNPKELKDTILKYFDEMKKLGNILMGGLALSLDLEENFFINNGYTDKPLCLFRLFNYPPPFEYDNDLWSVGEHRDYGVFTILKQDSLGGLEIKNRNSQWIKAPFIENTFVINIGDMLEKMTHGLYRSTPHRVKNPANRNRISFPFFFDPNFDAKVGPLPLSDRLKEYLKNIKIDEEHWDNINFHKFEGTYGEYILKKVSKVFPQLAENVYL